jgi:glycosyltransferase involved in cell wall biosynthesis
MILGIDASNLRSGGTVAHLSELLNSADPAQNGFSKVILFAEKSLLGKINNYPWLIKVHEPLLDKSLLHRLYWQAFRASRLAHKFKCNLLFVPSGIILGSFKPVVAMSHNLLPFQWTEIKRYGVSWHMLRNLLLHLIQSSSFKRAEGMVIASSFAQNAINIFAKQNIVIPHGVHKNFQIPPKQQFAIEEYTSENPFRILYVSTIDMYKHQWQVAEAVASLRSTGLPLKLELAGSAFPPALEILEKTIARVDAKKQFVKYLGIVPHVDLPDVYAQADLFIFASSCENMPNILLEAMASGLPIASSKLGPMPEVLGDAGVYFDPENPTDIARAMYELINSPELRAEKANASYKLSKYYSWKRCASETFNFFEKICKDFENK